MQTVSTLQRAGQLFAATMAPAVYYRPGAVNCCAVKARADIGNLDEEVTDSFAAFTWTAGGT